MVRLEKVSKGYGSGDNVIRAVDEITLEVGDGEFVIITGPSGSGKTTLLNLIGGMTRPDQGKIMVGDKDVLAMSDAGLIHSIGRVAARPLAHRDVAPPGVRTVIDRVHSPAGRQHQVVRIAETWRIDLHRSAGHELRLVLAVVAAKRIVRVSDAAPRLVVQRRQVVRRIPDRIQIDRQNGRRQGELRQQ